ncbi:MAG: hybrid sensor histidine kinase/response regulator [Ignavibacteriaceae bacterium]
MKTKIILLEDEANVRESILEILVSGGYEVAVVEPDVNLFENINSNKPDLIISDIMMPGKSGIDVFNEIKNNEETQEIPFIFLTAKSEYTDIRFGMSLGADDYVLKPFKAKDLLRSVELRLIKSKKIKERLHNFSSSVALHLPHELRTPLISLLGYSDMIIEDYNNLTDNEILDYTKGIKRSSQRLHRIIEKFILYADILSSELNNNFSDSFISKKTIEIGKLINLYSLSEAMQFNRQNDLEINIEPCESTMTEESISIIISQLLENAFKYSVKGTKVDVTVEKVNVKYFVSIKDNGTGMTKEQVANLSAFQQFNRGLLNQSGNGLGIVIVQKILSFSNSKLNIFSEPGKGTTVSFQL